MSSLVMISHYVKYNNINGRKLSFQVNLADHTGNQWVTCFQESAECILNVKADDLGNMKESVSLNLQHVQITYIYSWMGY